MATWGGLVFSNLYGITLAKNAKVFSNHTKQVAYLDRPYPPAVGIQFAYYDQLFVTNPTHHRLHTIVSVHINSQHGNRHQREDNVGRVPYDGQGIGFDWFERIHVKPGRYDLGNVVSNVLKVVDVYSAYRSDDRSWTAFTNNAGDGINILNLPSLPHTIIKQSSYVVNVEITPSGPPTINGTLDFIFDVGTASVTITGTRIILYGFAPTGAVTERLSWKTNIMKSVDGTEQRIALRRFPRQEIEFESILPRDIDRTEFDAFLFDWHSRVFGVPLWWDARQLSQNAAIGDSMVYVTSTNFADFREGGLAVIIAYDANGNRTADTLEISAVSSSPPSITFTSTLANAYTTGNAVVVPVIPGILGPAVERKRYAAGQQRVGLKFLSLDNDIARPDGTWVGIFKDWHGRPVIEDTNFIDKQLPENFRKNIRRIDGDTGEVLQTATEDRSTPTTRKRWNTETAERSWEIRNLLYALRGRHASFFMPTHGADMELAASVSAGAASIDVTNFGYAQFIKDREPFTSIVIRFDPNNPPIVPSPLSVAGSPSAAYTPGDSYFYAEITGSTELSSTVERLSVTPVIPISFTPDNVLSIQFMIKSRFDTDTIELLHKWTDLKGDEVDSEINATVTGAYDI